MSEVKLNAVQIESILDRLIPLIAAPEDHSFFRGVIGLRLESMNSGRAAAFVNELLSCASKCDRSDAAQPL